MVANQHWTVHAPATQDARGRQVVPQACAVSRILLANIRAQNDSAMDESYAPNQTHFMRQVRRCACKVPYMWKVFNMRTFWQGTFERQKKKKEKWKGSLFQSGLKSNFKDPPPFGKSTLTLKVIHPWKQWQILLGFSPQFLESCVYLDVHQMPVRDLCMVTWHWCDGN